MAFVIAFMNVEEKRKLTVVIALIRGVFLADTDRREQTCPR
jgi:hypothetical protein